MLDRADADREEKRGDDEERERRQQDDRRASGGRWSCPGAPARPASCRRSPARLTRYAARGLASGVAAASSGWSADDQFLQHLRRFAASSRAGVDRRRRGCCRSAPAGVSAMPGISRKASMPPIDSTPDCGSDDHLRLGGDDRLGRDRHEALDARRRHRRRRRPPPRSSRRRRSPCRRSVACRRRARRRRSRSVWRSAVAASVAGGVDLRLRRAGQRLAFVGQAERGGHGADLGRRRLDRLRLGDDARPARRRRGPGRAPAAVRPAPCRSRRVGLSERMPFGGELPLEPDLRQLRPASSG